MNLLVDIGNTSVKWALAGGRQLEATGRFTHRDRDLAVLLEQAWADLAAPDRLVVTNVAGADLAESLSEWTGRRWQARPRFIRAGRQAAGVTNAYPVPEQLGADRWAALIAAWHAAGGAVCAVDCGTAITFDLVDPAGRHRGGLIVAGLALMQQALYAQTAGLQPPGDDQSAGLPATSTGAAISGGCRYAAAAAIDRIVAELAASTGLQPEVIITGGDAQTLMPLLRVDARHDADLVLKGIAILAGES